MDAFKLLAMISIYSYLAISFFVWIRLFYPFIVIMSLISIYQGDDQEDIHVFIHIFLPLIEPIQGLYPSLLVSIRNFSMNPMAVTLHFATLSLSIRSLEKILSHALLLVILVFTKMMFYGSIFSKYVDSGILLMPLVFSISSGIREAVSLLMFKPMIRV